MSLEKEYKRILDEAFGRHFSGWDALSPLDPVKVLSEAMTGSLGQIEKRQRQYVSALMDSIPSLCGFTPKNAELPVTLLSFSPVPRLNEIKHLPPGTAFRFQKEEISCEALAHQSFRVTPLYDLKVEAKGPTLELSFRYQGIASELQLQFVPNAVVTPTLLSGAQIEVEGKTLDLRVEDSTSDFRRFGSLNFRAPQKDGLIFEQGTQKARLTLVFDGKLPQGEIAANLAAFRLAQMAEPLALGFLTGEPWEEVALPEEVVESPSEVFLSFADEQTLTLTRRESSLLELKQANYETFKGSFFYNGANHSLIVPASDELVGNYNGKVQVFARTALLRPASETLSSEMQGRVGDHSAVVEKVAGYRSLSTYLPREAKRNYLARFYAAMGALQMQASSVLNTHDLQQQLLSSENELRAVETQFDAKENKLTVYLLSVNPHDPEALQLSSELLGRISSKLSQILPLTIRWQIQPFTKIPVSLSLQASADVASGFANAGEAKESLKTEMKQWLRPFPFGQLRASTVYSVKDLARNFKLETLTGAAVKNGIISDTLLRQPGEIFEADIQVQVSLQRREVSYVA